jgi:putative transposase
VSIRQRLYPAPEVGSVLTRHCADARYVWNLGLEQRGYWKQGMKSLSVYDQKRELTEARSANPWLADGSSSVQQQALFDLDRAFKNWWKNPGHFSRPTWRRAGVHEGFYVRDLKVRRLNHKWGEVQIPKAGWVRFRISQVFAEVEQASSSRITLDRAGRWHVSFTTPAPGFERVATGAVVGLDLGIAASVTTSDGEHLTMSPLLSPGERQRKRRLQRQLARQTKGSARRCRTRTSLAKLSAKEADRRKDWIEKTTTGLVRAHDLIILEDLMVKNMVRSAKGTLEFPGTNVRAKAGLNRSISNQAWAQFRTRLTDKATHATSPCEVVAVNPANTSRRCSVCSYTAKENRKSQAVFSCQSCGHTENADVNAALNILAAGLAVSGRGGTPHATPGTPVEHSGPVKRQPPALVAA